MACLGPPARDLKAKVLAIAMLLLAMGLLFGDLLGQPVLGAAATGLAAPDTDLVLLAAVVFAQTVSNPLCSDVCLARYC